MYRPLVLPALLACLPFLAHAGTPNAPSSHRAAAGLLAQASAPSTSPAATPAPAPPAGTPSIQPPATPADWAPALASVANIDVLSAEGTPLRRTHGISLGDPPVLLARYSDLAGGVKVTAMFRDGTTVTATSFTAADPANDLVVLKSDGALPSPPQPAASIRWRYAKVFVIPAPAQGDTAIAESVNEPLKLDAMRVIPLSGDLPGGLAVMDVQGKWIGISGRIEDATGTFGYVTGSEDVIPVLFGPQKESPLSVIPAKIQWCPPDDAKGMLVRAVLRAHLKPEEAPPFFQLALKRDPKLAEVPYWMGVIDFRKQSYTDAESSFVHAGRLRPGWLLPWHMAGAAANQQGHYEIALEHYGRALAIDPKSAMTLGNQAGAYYNLHRIDDSMKSLMQAIEADSTYTPAYQMMGAVYLKQGRRDEAERIYQKLLTMDTRTAQSLRDLLDGKE